MKHPEELLAAYVDGTLEERERADVDAHIGTCDTCREEVALAGRARSALASLPDLDVPADTVRPGIERNGPKWQRDRFRRTAWATGFAAAAGIAAILALVLVHNPAPTTGGMRQETQPRFPLHGAVVQSTHNFDAPAIRALASDLAHRVAGSSRVQKSGTAATASGGGGAAPNPSAAPAMGVASPNAKFSALEAAGSPKACVRQGAALDGAVRLLQVIEAKYRGTPAYIGAFLQDGALPDTVVVSVVSKAGCKLLTVVQQRLP